MEAAMDAPLDQSVCLHMRPDPTQTDWQLATRVRHRYLQTNFAAVPCVRISLQLGGERRWIDREHGAAYGRGSQRSTQVTAI